jgi:5-methyltetrahydrofolate--homocysteine methyltransferase
VDVPPDRFVGIVREKNVGIVALSALLSTTMANMKVTIDALAQAGVRDRVKVIVGGAPVTQRFATEIGADGFSETASGAVQVARGLAKV